MKIILFTHPDFLRLKSMTRFASMLTLGMVSRGHEVEVWSPQARFFKLPLPGILKKWMGYIDQYVIFPLTVKRRLATLSDDTLFVFADHALGPWVPLVADRPNVVHCHDFLAQRSAIGDLAEMRLSGAGRIYQRYIRKGYQRATHFISVSEKTRSDLRLFLNKEPVLSEVVYNGLDPQFRPGSVLEARCTLETELGADLSSGYFLHIGTNHWYKNRRGVLEVYHRWRNSFDHKVPLVLLGEPLSDNFLKLLQQSPYKDEIHVLPNVTDALLQSAYSGAVALLFPSIEEGFGWPIAEAMACGTLLITTNKAPMTEIAGDAGFIVSAYPLNELERVSWADEVSSLMERLFLLSTEERGLWIEKGIANASRFELHKTLDEIERIYNNVR